MSEVLYSGTTRIRTGDTRIFSPMLYQLSYGTSCFCLASAKVRLFFGLSKLFGTFFVQRVKKVSLHEPVIGEILLQSVCKTCHYGNEFSLFVGHFDVAVGQFVVIEQLVAFGNEVVTQLC